MKPTPDYYAMQELSNSSESVLSTPGAWSHPCHTANEKRLIRTHLERSDKGRLDLYRLVVAVPDAEVDSGASFNIGTCYVECGLLTTSHNDRVFDFLQLGYPGTEVLCVEDRCNKVVLTNVGRQIRS